MTQISSRERLLLAINHQEPDRVPICFRGVAPLDKQWKSRFERVVGLAKLGVDDKLSIHVPWHYHPDVRVRQWWERWTGERYPLMIKELETPRGALRLVVRETEDHIPEDLPLINDLNWPRGVEFLVKGPEDLEKLSYLLYDPGRTDLSGFYEHVKAVKSFAATHGVLVEGVVTSISDAIFSFLGPTNLMYMVMDDRDFVVTLLGMVHEWTIRQLEILLDVGVDVIYSQGCYETTEFWSPQLIRELFLPLRKEAVEVVHQAGAKFHYYTVTGIMPLILDYKEIGIDILSSLDPLGTGDGYKTVDLAKIKETIGGEVCLWGGVDPEHTIELGTQEEVREAVRTAIFTCAPGGGFVLSTSGSVYNSDKRAYENVMTFIQAAHEFGKYPIQNLTTIQCRHANRERRGTNGRQTGHSWW